MTHNIRLVPYLHTANITPTTLEESVIWIPNFLHQSLSVQINDINRYWTYTKRVQTPIASLPHQAKNVAKIIREYNATEPANVTKTRGLEDLFVLQQFFLVLLGVRRWECVWIFVISTLVDLVYSLGDVLGDTKLSGQTIDRFEKLKYEHYDYD